MKLKDILTSKTWNQYGDMDVINDVVDEFHPAWCGQYCTEEGEKVFKEALELEAEIWNAGTQKYPEYRIMVHIDGPEGVWQKRRRIVSKLFSDMCGYCTCEEYDKWFIDPEEDEFHLTPQGDPDEDSLERIGKLEDMFSNAMDWIFDHIKQEDIRDMMEHVGYSQEEIDQYYKEFMQ